METSLPILRKRREFVQVAQNGRKFITNGLVLQVWERPQENSFDDVIRVGFTTTKKIGNAVKRNRVRRRLRVLARLILPEFGTKRCDYVLIGRTATYDKPFEALKNDLMYALKKI